MMTKSLLRTILVTVFVTASLFANDASVAKKPVISECPEITESDLKTLAGNGEVKINGKSFSLIFEKETGNNYNKRLIESQADLASFLKSGATQTVTRHINSHQNPFLKDHLKNHCPYDLERESDIAVIAIAPAS
jgi:hypothetical protein